jgi:flagellar protein FliS
MANNSPASVYQQLAARGASPVGLVVSLYDTILRDFRRAQAALVAGNIERRVFELNHALTVIAHLQSVLNHERGGEAAKNFDRFYQVTRPMILDASVRCTPDSLDKLINMYTSLRQAWQQIEPQFATAQSIASQPSVPQSNSALPSQPPSPPKAPGSQPQAPRTSNWNA